MFRRGVSLSVVLVAAAFRQSGLHDRIRQLADAQARESFGDIWIARVSAAGRFGRRSHSS